MEAFEGVPCTFPAQVHLTNLLQFAAGRAGYDERSSLASSLLVPFPDKAFIHSSFKFFGFVFGFLFLLGNLQVSLRLYGEDTAGAVFLGP